MSPDAYEQSRNNVDSGEDALPFRFAQAPFARRRLLRISTRRPSWYRFDARRARVRDSRTHAQVRWLAGATLRFVPELRSRTSRSKPSNAGVSKSIIWYAASGERGTEVPRKFPSIARLGCKNPLTQPLSPIGIGAREEMLLHLHVPRTRRKPARFGPRNLSIVMTAECDKVDRQTLESVTTHFVATGCCGAASIARRPHDIQTIRQE